MQSIFFIMSSCFLWSTDLFLREPLNGSINNFDLLFYEYGIAIIFLAPWVLGNSLNEFKKFKKSHFAGFFIIGVIGSSVGSYILSNNIYQWGMESYSFFQFIQPVFVALLAAKSLNEKFDKKNISWFFLILVAGCLMNFPDIQSGVFLQKILNNPFHILATILVTLIWGACTVIGKWLLETYSPLFLTFIRWIFAFLATSFMIAWNGPPQLDIMNTKISVTILFISLISGFFAMALYYKGLKQLKATSVAYLELFYPIFTLGMSSLVLYKDQHLYQVIGISLLTIIIATKILVNESSILKQTFKKFQS